MVAAFPRACLRCRRIIPPRPRSHPNSAMMIWRRRGYKNLPYLLLKAQRMAVTNTEFVAVGKAA